MKKFKNILITGAALISLTVGLAVPASAARCRRAGITELTRLLWDRLGIFCTIADRQEPKTTTAEPEAPKAEPEVPKAEPEAPKWEPEQTPTEPKPSQTDRREESKPSSGSALDYERQVVELVNEQRRAYGLAELKLDEALCQKARIKSEDMAKNGYFSHTSPTYGSPFDMMHSLGITYRAAGENIAMGYSTPAAVVTAWMNSEGHRANILSASYTTLGVGYVAAGGYWTQWFIG